MDLRSRTETGSVVSQDAIRNEMIAILENALSTLKSKPQSDAYLEMCAFEFAMKVKHQSSEMNPFDCLAIGMFVKDMIEKSKNDST